MNRVYYIGMISPESYGKAIEGKVFSGAAEKKMLSLSFAMRRAGEKSIIVTLPHVGKEYVRGDLLRTRVFRDSLTPIISLPTFRSTFVRKIVAPLLFLVFVVRRIERKDRVIFYNHALEYIPANLYLWLRRYKTFLDIEDAPGPDERGLRSLLSKFSFFLITRLTSPRKIVVSPHVAHSLKLDSYLAVPGVAAKSLESDASETGGRWLSLSEGGPIKIHYGGTISPDTGVELFLNGVTRLSEIEDRLKRPVVFIVTGRGDFDYMREKLRQINESERIGVQFHPHLSIDEYEHLVNSCHCAISLRPPERPHSNRTFPSKVIDITGRGIALISTDQGGVFDIYPNGSAIALRNCSPEEFADTISMLSARPHLIRITADRGYRICIEKFAADVVGRELVDFVR